MEIIKLNDDEFLCSRCEGDGWLIQKDIPKVCSKCLGAGKVDWLEQICGIKKWHPLGLTKTHGFELYSSYVEKYGPFSLK